MKQSMTAKALERWKDEMPREDEMWPKDKYTIFDRKEKKYRKGIHSELPFFCSLLLLLLFSLSLFLFSPGFYDRGSMSMRRENNRGGGMEEYRIADSFGWDGIELPKWTRVSQRLNPRGF